MLTIIDYGLGNIIAFKNVYDQLNIPVKIAKNKNDLQDASRIILPGVGSFDWAMKRLNNSGMRATIEDFVLNKKIPILGVCVGMQIMALESEEGEEKGLGWLKTEVKKFCNSLTAGDENEQFPIPHMGWNKIILNQKSNLFEDINELEFYFLHSYFLHFSKKDIILSSTNYISQFVSSFQQDNIYGVQFHPEKSHGSGKKLLSNFAKI